VPVRFGIGSSTYSALHPAGATVASSMLGRVTRNDGSAMGRPSSISARNELSHAAPKWMLWWAAPAGGPPRTPATQSTQLGEYRPRLAARGASTPPSRVR